MSSADPHDESRISEQLRANQVAPSILSADFARLGAQVDAVLGAGARVIHMDVMDGHFVPPITFGPKVVAALSQRVHAAGALVDVHLMIEHPERQIAAFIAAGADSISVHVEATPHLHYALAAIRAGGARAGAAICPGTPVSVLSEVAADGVLDVALCMSVNPGWGSQTLIPHSFEKLRTLRAALPPEVAIEVDGGINTITAHDAASAGANLLVAGSAVFGNADPASAFMQIRDAAWPPA